MWTVLEHKSVVKQLDKCPRHIAAEYELWRATVENSGPYAIRKIPGYRDHALEGKWKGFRSSSLDRKWRVIYQIHEDEIMVQIEELTAHDYRKKN